MTEEMVLQVSLLDAARLSVIVDNFVAKVKSNVEQNQDIVSSIKVAMTDCNREVAESVLSDDRFEAARPELRAEIISNVLQDAIKNYSEGMLDSADADYSLKKCYLELLQATLGGSYTTPQDAVEPPSYMHTTTPVYAISLAAEICQPLPLIIWKDFPKKLENKDFVSLMLQALLIRYPETRDFLTVNIVQNEIDKLLNDNVDEAVTSKIKKFNQECGWTQRVHLLSYLYVELIAGLEKKYSFNLGTILESRLTNLYIEQKIQEQISLLPEEFASLYTQQPFEEVKSVEPLLKKMLKEESNNFTFQEQVHLVFPDRAILYIYREYLRFNQDKLSSQGIYFSEDVLPADNQSYDEWYDIAPALKERSIDDTIALCKWFKKHRPEVEAWYKSYYADYEQYWSKFYFAEVRNRCFLLGENLEACRNKRNQLAEIFNDVAEMHYVLTPHTLCEILDAFKDRVSRKIEQHGREEKEKALTDAVNGINRDIAKVLSQSMVMDRQLLASVYEYVGKDNNRYMDFLRATLGNNCPRAINDQFQLEKYFLLQALVFNMMGYLFTYAYYDKPSLYSNCAWNGVASSSSDVWGLVRGKLFHDSNAGTSLPLREELNNPKNYIIECADFYSKFQKMTKPTASMFGIEIEEDEDLIDKFFLPPSSNKHQVLSASLKRAITHFGHAAAGALTPLRTTPHSSVHGSLDGK